MSVGNLKTDGQKGNNFPWQLRMLKGLQAIAPNIRTPNVYSDTGPGTLPSTYNYGFSIANVGATNGFVDGAVLKPGYTVSFSPTSVDYLNNINYDATDTEFLITYID
jgi:hypothetical protein